MKTCPVCPHTELIHGFLETGLPAYECSQCGGIWISANEYLTWVLVQELSTTIKPAPDNSLPIPDTNQAILCPDCGRILRRYRIWPDIDFHLDRCGDCNGVWFDKNEWQVLKLNDLHNQVNHFFTESWQRKLREEETRRRFEKMYRDKFGPEDYTEVKRIKTWLTHHPLGPSLLAYLSNQRPYRG